MTELPSQTEWLSAFRKKDGYRLMTLLREEPRLLNCKYRGCNVLHLAIRHNWFGLVEEILRKFDHLGEGASSINESSASRLQAANPDQDTEDPASHRTAEPQATTGDFRRKSGPALDLATFRNLLTATEGDGDQLSEINASGLDVFALAVIQGHGAIDTILANAVSKVDRLFNDDHPYKKVIRNLRWIPDTEAISCASSTHTKEREMLRDIMEDVFAKESTENLTKVKTDDVTTASKRPDIAPNTFATETKITPDSQGTNVSCILDQTRRLEDKIEVRLIERWKLTSPFLPLEEFLFLACQAQEPWLCSRHKNAVELVFKRCAERKGETSFMKYLFAINDTRWTALHHAVCNSKSIETSGRREINPGFDLIPNGEEFRDCVNARDNLGRTLVHIAIATGGTDYFERLLKDDRTDLNAICGFGIQLSDDEALVWESSVKIISEVNGYGPNANNYRSDQTALHLVIKSPHLGEQERRAMVQLLLNRDGANVDLNTLQLRVPEIKNRFLGTMTPLQFAAYLGDASVLELLASDDRAYDPARIKNVSKIPNRFSFYSALHIAAMVGNPDAIRIILATGKFDPVVPDRSGNSALHLATCFEFPFQFSHTLTDFFKIPDKRQGTYKSKESLSADEHQDMVRMGESRRQGCINLLLQAGIDIWQTNRDNEIADVGPEASSEYSALWYEILARETQEAKSRWNAAANAISVTAALVATASYVGPLQPPLGYAAEAEGLIDKIQVGILSVRIFIVTNTLSFYVALAAVMLSLTPSLPMPQQSMFNMLKLIRRSVTWAMCFLILAIVFVLLAFASASIAAIPDEGSWNHGGLTSSTMSVGGAICVVVLLLCGVRLLRLLFHKSNTLRRFYNSYVPL